MKKQIIAAIAASVLFCAAFALGTGASVNVWQAIPACILMAASAALFRYAERSSFADAEVKSEGVKSEKSIRKAQVA